MPRLKSAIKRVKTSERNRLRNIAVKSRIKTLLKKVQDLVSKKDTKSAGDAAREAFAALDRAATKRVYHLNNAARKKSRISKWLKTLEPSSSKS
ncbi:MAG: 30S ribosomal protein S20 [Candidatus Melainabacteria bacterium RIFCSPHIGHO2_02_FULL_34_12]|nr:MAG: 30S ribosomal protein S20 [Candidatus Melainabacteria bacterium RIFCSPHIGHO2_02_FULL_34_12]